jgi:hypothetical protein
LSLLSPASNCAAAQSSAHVLACMHCGFEATLPQCAGLSTLQHL